MKKRSSIKNSQTDWKRIKSMPDTDIDLSEIPEISEDRLKKATLRIDGIPVSESKVRVNIYLDSAVVEYFKMRAGKRGYQTLINEALKENVRGNQIEAVIRQTIREELGRTKKSNS